MSEQGKVKTNLAITRRRRPYALENNWGLVIEEDKNLPNGKVTQKVSGTYSHGTGDYTITKTVTWNWC